MEQTIMIVVWTSIAMGLGAILTRQFSRPPDASNRAIVVYPSRDGTKWQWKLREEDKTQLRGCPGTDGVFDSPYAATDHALKYFPGHTVVQETYQQQRVRRRFAG